MIFQIDVKNQTLKHITNIGDTPARQGSSEYLFLKFVFSEDWNGLIRTVYFQAGEYSEPIILTSDSVLVPTYFTQQPKFNVTLVGIDGSKVVPTSTLEIHMAESNTIWTAVPPDTDIPAYQQLVQLAQLSQQIAQSVRDDADAGRFDGDPGPQGEKGETGDTGERGEKGDQGEQGQRGSRWYSGRVPGVSTDLVEGDMFLCDGTSPLAAYARGTVYRYSKPEGVNTWTRIENISGHTPVRGTDYWTQEDKAEITTDTINAAVDKMKFELIRSQTVRSGGGAMYITTDLSDQVFTLSQVYVVIKSGAADNVSIAGHLFFDNDDTKRVQVILGGANQDYIAKFGIRQLGTGFWEVDKSSFMAPTGSFTMYSLNSNMVLPVIANDLQINNGVTKIAVTRNAGLPVGTQVFVYGVRKNV